MKKQAIHDLGLDVHQATIVATPRNEPGAIVLKATTPTEAKAIVGLVRSQGPRVHVAFEEGTQAQWHTGLAVVTHPECRQRDRGRHDSPAAAATNGARLESQSQPGPRGRRRASWVIGSRGVPRVC